ncbi:MAG TPA: hypothetical protein PKA02_00455 [Candidatus Saccharibacteria bacterium]|nr:hypothetical protein [Candidatus Saccharibacteria bacterium]
MPDSQQGVLGFDPTPEAIPGQLGMLERLEVVSRTRGFLPTTHDELNDAVGLIAFQGEPGRSAQYLNEVLLHQKKATTVDPKMAVHSKTAEFAGFAGSAQEDTGRLLLLKADIAELMNPAVPLLEDIGDRTDGGVRQLVRFIDQSKFLESGGKDRPFWDPFKKAARVRGPNGGRTILDPYSVPELDPNVVARIERVMARTSVKDARLLVDRAIADQEKRLAFWVDRLRETRAHALSRPIANRALEHLGVAG